MYNISDSYYSMFYIKRLCTHTCIHTLLPIHSYIIYLHTHVSVYIYICVCVCVSACVYVCVCAVGWVDSIGRSLGENQAYMRIVKPCYFQEKIPKKEKRENLTKSVTFYL